MRSMTELETECQEKGLETKGFKHKEQFMDTLAEFYWETGTHQRSFLTQLAPMLASNSKDYTDEEQESMFWGSDNCVGEPKLDGCRFKMHCLEPEVRFDSRRRSDQDYLYSEKTDNFPHLRDLKVPQKWLGCVVDGEILMPLEEIWTESVTAKGVLECTKAVTNCGSDKSQRIQEANRPCEYWMFDVILGVRGEDLSGLSFERRRHILEVFHKDLVEANPGMAEYLKITPQYKGVQMLEEYRRIVEEGGEGIMLKFLVGKNAGYKATGRSKGIFKKKRFETMDGFITGSVPGDKGIKGLLGAFKVSCYDEQGNIHEFAAAQPRHDGLEKRESIEFRKQVSGPPDDKGDGTLNPEWLNQCVEVRGQEVHVKTLRFRHATILRLRPDKTPKDCVNDFSKWRSLQ